MAKPPDDVVCVRLGILPDGKLTHGAIIEAKSSSTRGFLKPKRMNTKRQYLKTGTVRLSRSVGLPSRLARRLRTCCFDIKRKKQSRWRCEPKGVRRCNNFVLQIEGYPRRTFWLCACAQNMYTTKQYLVCSNPNSGAMLGSIDSLQRLALSLPGKERVADLLLNRADGEYFITRIAGVERR